MLGAPPRQRRKPIADSSDRLVRADNPVAPQRPPAGPVADAYCRLFLELPVPVALAALWLLGAVLLSAVVTTAYLAAAAIL